jgi:hypothetical protein
MCGTALAVRRGQGHAKEAAIPGANVSIPSRPLSAWPLLVLFAACTGLPEELGGQEGQDEIDTGVTDTASGDTGDSGTDTDSDDTGTDNDSGTTDTGETHGRFGGPFVVEVSDDGELTDRCIGTVTITVGADDTLTGSATCVFTGRLVATFPDGLTATLDGGLTPVDSGSDFAFGQLVFSTGDALSWEGSSDGAELDGAFAGTLRSGSGPLDVTGSWAAPAVP